MFTVIQHAGVPALILCLAAPVMAQTEPPPAGSIVVERVEEGFVYAPDVRITEVDHETATLVGGYVGWLTDRTWLVGAGGYWLANQDDDLRMAYGGLVVEWLAPGGERIGFGVRGLVGGGRATVGSTVGEYFGAGAIDPSRLASRSGHAGRWVRDAPGSGLIDADTPLLVREYFFVAEPQANLILHFTRWARLDLGLGYRLAAGAGTLDDELSGATASVAIQFGGSSRKKP